MSDYKGRRNFLRNNRAARAFAALDRATRQTKDPLTKEDIPPGFFDGKEIVVIGSGIGGLTTAYEIAKNNKPANIKLLEARPITGGRCLTLRDKDKLVEDTTSELNQEDGETTCQTVNFECVEGDEDPYLNAGPGRIPSSHTLLLEYLRDFKTDLEVYIMNSESNLVQMDAGIKGAGEKSEDPVVYRRVIHNTRGRIAESVFQNAQHILKLSDKDAEKEPGKSKIENLESLMVTFGELDANGCYVVEPSDPGVAAGSDRAGYSELPGVHPGTVAPAFSLDQLLDSQYWENTRLYQPVDYLWQPTLFQPAGGMDKVQKSFVDAIEKINDDLIKKDSPVTKIDYDFETSKYLISVNGETSHSLTADYVFCNAAIPFLESIVTTNLLPKRDEESSESVRNGNNNTGFSPDFVKALHQVFITQENPSKTSRFLANTTKVGWQADRCLWQGPFTSAPTKSGVVPGDEVGVVPIYGGISWTQEDITQIWYPSNGYNDVKGTLTGCYNFGSDAVSYGEDSPEERKIRAQKAACKFGSKFSGGLDLERGVSIAWQNMRYIKGGWTQWQSVDDSADHFTSVVNGTAVNGASNRTFFMVGDQASTLPGWQEGAVASAIQALLCATVNFQVPRYLSLPDTRIMVEGI